MPTEAVTNPAHIIPTAKPIPDDLDAAATSDVCLRMIGTAAAAITMATDAIAVDFTWASASKSRVVQVDGTFVKLANLPQRVTPSQVPPACKSRPVCVLVLRHVSEGGLCVKFGSNGHKRRRYAENSAPHCRGELLHLNDKEEENERIGKGAAYHTVSQVRKTTGVASTLSVAARYWALLQQVDHKTGREKAKKKLTGQYV